MIAVLIGGVAAPLHPAQAATDDSDGGTSVSVTITDDATPTPTVPSPEPSLANLPADGSSLVIDGFSVPLGRTVSSNGVGLVFTRGSFRVEIAGRDSRGVSLRVDTDGDLIVESGGSVFVRGSGFQASTPVAVYLFSTPVLLGQLSTDASGAFSGAFALPAGVSVGVHTVQVVGTVDADRRAVLSAGLRVYPPPSSTSVVAAPTSTRGSSAPGGATTVEQTPVSDSQADGLTEEPGTLDLGVFAMSALHAVAEPSLSLSGGVVNLSIIVRNTSPVAFDATARFWLNSVFGPPIASIDGIPVAGLQPGEARQVTARFEGVGNWTFYRGYVTLTPPEVVGNTELVPVTREADVFVPPPAALPVVGVLGLAALALVLWLALTGRLWFLVFWRKRDDDEEDPDGDLSGSDPGTDQRELATSGVAR